MEDLVIVGHSGFAKEIKWLIDRINEKELSRFNFLGYIDKNADSDAIGDDDYLLKVSKKLSVIIAIADPKIRKGLFLKYQENTNLDFPSVIDPSVIFDRSISMGKGNIICAGTILTVGVCLGEFNIINLDCTIGHEAELKDFVTLNPSVNVSGNAIICTGANIGTGSQILQGLEIGENVIVGAGAVVNKSLPSCCTAVGVPAKIIKHA